MFDGYNRKRIKMTYWQEPGFFRTSRCNQKHSTTYIIQTKILSSFISDTRPKESLWGRLLLKEQGTVQHLPEMVQGYLQKDCPRSGRLPAAAIHTPSTERLGLRIDMNIRISNGLSIHQHNLSPADLQRLAANMENLCWAYSRNSTNIPLWCRRQLDPG